MTTDPPPPAPDTPPPGNPYPPPPPDASPLDPDAEDDRPTAPPPSKRAARRTPRPDRHDALVIKDRAARGGREGSRDHWNGTVVITR